MGVAEVFLPFQFPAGDASTATSIKSTLLVSGLQALRSRQLFDGYFKKLPPQTQQDITALVAASWAPMSLALEHYRALDALALSNDVIESIGRDVSERISKNYLSTLVRATKQVGSSPWTLLSLAHRLRELSWNGSDMCVYKLGPKEARVEWVAQPLAASTYFVTSFGGYLQAAAGLFCTRAYTKNQNEFVSRTNRIVYRLSWV